MIQTLEAVIDEHGIVRLLESIQLSEPGRALVTVLADAPLGNPNESALLSEAALVEDWNRPEGETPHGRTCSRLRSFSPFSIL